MTDLPTGADELYDLPLAEFTKARTALEKKLRGDGKRDEAAEVKALRKPTAPAWALNQVARGRPKDVKKLLDASRAVGAAQDDPARRRVARRPAQGRRAPARARRLAHGRRRRGREGR